MSSKKVIFGSAVLASALVAMTSPIVVKDGVAVLADHIDLAGIEETIAQKTGLQVGTKGFTLAATTDGVMLVAYNKLAYDDLALFGARFAGDVAKSDESEFKTTGQVRFAFVSKDDLIAMLDPVVRDRRIEATKVTMTDNAWATLMGSLYGYYSGQKTEQKRA